MGLLLQDGVTALLLAADRGNKEVVEQLMEAGAALDVAEEVMPAGWLCECCNDVN
jgi:ankyrin repeat protein